MRRLGYIFFGLLLILSACDEYPVSNVRLSDSELAMKVGDSYQLEVIIEPLSSTYANTVSWTSSDPNVATVDAAGNVTAVYTGECEIIAKAGHKTASCRVVVDVLVYDFTFPQAKAFFHGDAYKSQSNNITLRLYSQGIYVSDNGEISGEGFFLNLDLQVPITEKLVQVGNYAASSTPLPMTFLPGDTINRNDTIYATGTFLGQYSEQGFGVIFIKQSVVTVSATGENYTVSCSIIGEKNEQITVNYSGKIPTFDISGVTPPEPLNLTFTTLNMEFLGTKYSTDYNVQRINLYSEGNAEQLQLELMVPLSVKDFIPNGTYSFSNTSAPFGIVVTFSTISDEKEGTWLYKDGGATPITKGYVVVSNQNDKVIFDCHLVDKNGRPIVGKN